MEPLRHLVEPSRLLVTWQPADERETPRTRRIVAEVFPSTTDPSDWIFRYFIESPDLKMAEGAGFKGYPAFKLDAAVFRQGVRDTLLRRLPPRSREDFSDYLHLHRLPYPFPLSDLALIGYTGARLPGDGFSFIPEFPLTSGQCEYILEVAGVRHNFKGDVSGIPIGDSVTFIPEPSNEVDDQAIAIVWAKQKLGYVSRALLPTFHHWLSHGSVQGSIERLNGKVDRPMIYVRLLATCETTAEAT